jgi:PIN domain nuclease of toxin-antitoxin system
VAEFVLDASALLALINGEAGADRVRPLMAQCVISAVNLCETIHRLRRRGVPVETVTATLASLVPHPIPFDEAMAYVAASIHERTRDQGISMGDCACLALALVRRAPAVTADQRWKAADLGVKVITIR